jgi:aldehyde:ferredoxin oxidoreductase
MHGYGDIVRIDLTTDSVTREPIAPELIKKFLGGMGINDWLLWEHFLRVDPLIDPMSKENVLIAGLGPLGATGFGLGSKMKFTFKSPSTGFFGDSTVGGNFSSHMRWAGVDHLVITGKAEKPVYLYIDSSKIEVRDAGHLWGLTTSETVDKLRSGEVHPESGIASIGPAGENGVRYACIVVTEDRAAGRTGSGCVAGSKNLKAIVAHGTGGISVRDPEAAIEATRKIFQTIDEDPLVYNFKKNGTLNMVDFYDAIGSNAYRNNQFSKVPDEKIAVMGSDWYAANIKLRDRACSPGCTFGCDSACRVKGSETELARRLAGPVSGSVEYLSIATFGMGCDIPDLPAITHFHETCNDFGMDFGEIGGIIPFLMELWERGIIKEEHTKEWFGEPLSFEWGSFDAVQRIIQAVALQENELGKICSQNIEKVSQALDKITDIPSSPYLVCGKGGLSFHEEMRSFPIWAVNAAVASRGCDHLKGLNLMGKASRMDVSMEWLGQPDAGIAYGTKMKGTAAAMAENYAAAINCAGVCIFRPATDPLRMPLRLITDAYAALTGIPLTVEELLRAGERACNLEKAFNSRIGLRRKDDRLCDRWMNEPVTFEYGEGMKAGDYLNDLLDEYYEEHGWDKPTSLQTRTKLDALGLSDVADVLEKENALIQA